VEPTLTLPGSGNLLKDIGKGAVDGAAYGLSPSGALRGATREAVMGLSARAQQWLIASPEWQAWLRAQMTPNGLSPAALGFLNGLGQVGETAVDDLTR
jgi:hypothetical protein